MITLVLSPTEREEWFVDPSFRHVSWSYHLDKESGTAVVQARATDPDPSTVVAVLKLGIVNPKNSAHVNLLFGPGVPCKYKDKCAKKSAVLGGNIALHPEYSATRVTTKKRKWDSASIQLDDVEFPDAFPKHKAWHLLEPVYAVMVRETDDSEEDSKDPNLGRRSPGPEGKHTYAPGSETYNRGLYHVVILKTSGAVIVSPQYGVKPADSNKWSPAKHVYLFENLIDAMNQMSLTRHGSTDTNPTPSDGTPRYFLVLDRETGAVVKECVVFKGRGVVVESHLSEDTRDSPYVETDVDSLKAFVAKHGLGSESCPYVYTNERLC